MWIRLLVIASTVALAGCASQAERLGLSEQEWQGLSSQKQEQMWADHEKIKTLNEEKSKKAYAGPELNIYMLKGKALMPPFAQYYEIETFAFRMQPGTCQSVTLKSVDTTNHVDMSVCYDGLKLSIDPSHYDLTQKDGSIFISYNPIWKRGFTYNNINSQGYVHLRDASISVKAIAK